MKLRTAGFLALALAVAACGRGGEQEQEQEPAAAPPESAQPAAGGAQEPQATPRPPAPDTAAEPASSGEASSGSDRSQPASRTTMPSRRLYTIQVAALDDGATARAWVGRLAERGYPAWTSTAEVGGRTYYRLRIGAHAEPSQVRALGARVRQEFQWPFWVAPVEDPMTISDDIVTATRTLLRGN